jgi:hypothetical protein
VISWIGFEERPKKCCKLACIQVWFMLAYRSRKRAGALLTRITQLLLHLVQSLNATFGRSLGKLKLEEIIRMSEAIL